MRSTALPRSASVVALLSVTLAVGCSSNPEPQRRAEPPQSSLVNQAATQNRAAQAQTLIAQGDAALAAERWKDAVALYKRALAAQPNRWETYLNLAIAQTKVPDFNAAIETMKQGMAKGGAREWRMWYNLGTMYQDRGLYEEAVKAYRVGLNYHDKPHLDSLLNIGSAYLFQHKVDEAKSTFEYVVRLAPNDPRGHHNLAMLDQLQNHHERAIRGYEGVHQIDPNYAQSYFNKGVSLRRIKRCDEAVTSFRKYISLEPNGPYVKRATHNIKRCSTPQS